jgi:hypothetical protein
LYFCIESVAETVLKINLSYGPEVDKTQLNNSEDEEFVIDFADLATRGAAKKKEEVLNTAAKNASEHQKRVRLQVE